MKYFTLFACCLAAASMASAAPTAPQLVRQIAKAHAASAAKGAKERIASGVKRWQPAKETVYFFDLDSEDWMLDEEIAKTYNVDAKPLTTVITSADGESKSLTTTTYDDLGRRILEIEQVDEGEGYLNSRRQTWTYDEVVENLIVAHTDDMWFDDAWQAVGNNYRRNIERNADGCITLCEVATLYQGEYDPSERLTITYGDNGQAAEISQTQLVYDGKAFIWRDVVTFSDLTWEDTNGQITQVDELYSGANRLLSGHRQSPAMDEGYTVDYDIAVTYEGDNYQAVLTGTGDSEGYFINQSFTKIDDNGSFDMTIEDGIDFWGEIWAVTTEMKYRCDEWGIITLQEEIASFGEDDDAPEIMRLAADVTYDEEGRPLEILESEYVYPEEEGEEGTMEYFRKSILTDYVDVTNPSSLGLNAADNSTAPVEYFDLMGRRVDSPAAGSILIRRQGSEVTKTIVK